MVLLLRSGRRLALAPSRRRLVLVSGEGREELLAVLLHHPAREVRHQVGLLRRELDLPRVGLTQERAHRHTCVSELGTRVRRPQALWPPSGHERKTSSGADPKGDSAPLRAGQDAQAGCAGGMRGGIIAKIAQSTETWRRGRAPRCWRGPSSSHLGAPVDKPARTSARGTCGVTCDAPALETAVGGERVLGQPQPSRPLWRPQSSRAGGWPDKAGGMRGMRGCWRARSPRGVTSSRISRGSCFSHSKARERYTHVTLTRSPAGTPYLRSPARPRHSVERKVRHVGFMCATLCPGGCQDPMPSA